MLNQNEEFLGIDRNSGFALRVLVLSVPAGLIFLIFGLLEVIPSLLAIYSYICILFFNTVFLLPMSAEVQQIKKYIQNIASGVSEEELLKNMTEKETRDLTEAINSMHKFWVGQTEVLKNRTLSDAAVLDTLPDPLLMINKSGTVIGANLAARSLFEADLNNKLISTVISDTGFNEKLQGVLNQEMRRTDMRISLTALKNKPKFYVTVTTLPWFAKGDVVAVISFYDLGRMLRFEQIQQDFVANASHELRTPLSIIAGFIETLQTTAREDKTAQDKFLHIMQEQAAFMSALIENLLSLSKIELTVDMKPEDKVDLNTLIREIKTALALKAQEQDLTIKTKFVRLPKIIADERQIVQVLQNLMDNAVKYATPHTEISVVTSKIAEIPPHRYYEVAAGEAVEISIANYGATIALEDLNRLTERFYRLQQHKDKNIKGTGLGLSIVAQILRRHRGNLVVTSAEGLTTFKVYLPLGISA